MSIEERLLSIKEQIDDAKNTKAQLEGKLESEMERLKELGCKSVKEAEALSKEKRKDAENLEAKVADGLKKFEEEYGF